MAGTAALVLSASPALTPKQVLNVIYGRIHTQFVYILLILIPITFYLKGTATHAVKQPDTGKSSCDGVAWNSWPNEIYGNGRLDAAAALGALQAGQLLTNT